MDPESLFMPTYQDVTSSPAQVPRRRLTLVETVATWRQELSGADM